MSEANQPLVPRPESFSWLGRPQLVRLLLGTGVLLCFVIFWWAGRLLGIPAGNSGSLLQSPASLAIVLILLVACTALGSAVAGTVRPDAGLFCATVGLAALSLRDGSIRDALHQANSPAILLALAAELIVLYVFVIACWALVRYLLTRGLLQPDVARDGFEHVSDAPAAGEGKSEDAGFNQKLAAAGAQIVVMLVVVLLLAPYDAKNQVLAAVGIGAWAGTVISHYFLHPVRPSTWYLAGPLVVGVIGYLIMYFVALGGAPNPAGWQTANLKGAFAALARPLPLDYASVGVAGALLGYWMSRRWRKQLQQA